MDSFVSGLLYVALDIDPKTPIIMFSAPGAELQEIPSIPNALEQLQAVAVRIVEKLDKVDINAVFSDASATFDSIKKIMTTPQLKVAVSNLETTRAQLGQTMSSMRHTFDDVDTHVAPLSTTLQKTSDSTNLPFH